MHELREMLHMCAAHYDRQLTCMIASRVPTLVVNNQGLFACAWQCNQTKRNGTALTLGSMHFFIHSTICLMNACEELVIPQTAGTM